MAARKTKSKGGKLPAGKGSVKGRSRKSVFPKYLEDFCQEFFCGASTRQAALRAGRAPSSGPRLYHRPDVQQRLKELEEEYKAASGQRGVAEAILTEEHLDEQILEMAVIGEKKRGRLRACEIGYRRLRLIDPPNAQTIIAMRMESNSGNRGSLNAPKLFEARRFVKLREAGEYNTENLSLKVPLPEEGLS